MSRIMGKTSIHKVSIKNELFSTFSIIIVLTQHEKLYNFYQYPLWKRDKSPVHTWCSSACLLPSSMCALCTMQTTMIILLITALSLHALNLFLYMVFAHVKLWLWLWLASEWYNSQFNSPPQ